MTELINLALRTEYSFKSTYGYLDELCKLPGDHIGIADMHNTYGHAFWEKYCSENEKKPIFGVRLNVALKPEPNIGKSGRKVAVRPTPAVHLFLAKNEIGLQEIYKLTKMAYEKFYYIPRITPKDVNELSNNVIVISEHLWPGIFNRVDYFGLSPLTPRNLPHYIEEYYPDDIGKPTVALNHNNYTYSTDRKVYQLLAGVARRGTGYNYLFNSSTYPQHILTTDEWYRIWKDDKAIENTHIIASQCTASIPKADRVKYNGKLDIRQCCIDGAKRVGINLESTEYSERLERELELIDQKGFTDYFLIVSDLCQYAKRYMLVGPSRGSSAGSLVCYLMGITEIDPLKHGLLFERFIDVNRFDFPDIDIDFHDDKREMVIDYLTRTYGQDKVAHLANYVTFRPKSAMGAFAAALDIPVFETQEVKNAIIERSLGDARAKMCMLDTFESTDTGREFIEKYPAMTLAGKIEAHASNTSTHAAGILVCNDDVTRFAGVHTRDNHIMLDKKSAEYLGLLKIDCLGLRTLSILEEACELAGLDKLHLYNVPLDDEKTFKLFNDMRLNGIFQFEGQALAFVTRQMGVHSFDDIAAITALARPGAMNSGGTNRYIKYKTGKDKPIYRGSVHKRITEESLGIVIYQEQMMFIAREVAHMSWAEVQSLRRAASSSLGDEFFSQYKKKFVDGAMEHSGLPENEALALWNDISTTGSWTFNKSHAVSYGLVSYWTAYMKANYPYEFAIANLNHTSHESACLRFLRDLVTNEGMEYVPVDSDVSDVRWTLHDGKLLGGLINIKGIGLKTAENILKMRHESGKYPLGVAKRLLDPKTPYDILFPAEHYFGDFYNDPDAVGISDPPDYIADVNDEGYYTIIGRVVDRDLRDRNDYQSVVKRGGRYVDDNQYYLKLTVEDDTDSILCIISPQDFDELNGKMLAETSIEGETWYIIKGSVKTDWRMITVDKIFNLQEFVDEKDAEMAKDSIYIL